MILRSVKIEGRLALKGLKGGTAPLMRGAGPVVHTHPRVRKGPNLSRLDGLKVRQLDEPHLPLARRRGA